MDEKYDVSELARVVPVERVTFVTTRGFDDVVAAIDSGPGRPDNFAALVQRWAAADSAETFDAAVAQAAGSAGLIEFLSLDLGEALAKHPGYQHYRLLRIIVGNPVTMASMTTTVADAGSYAPVTILVAQRPDGVHIPPTTESPARSRPTRAVQRRQWRWTSIARCSNCCVPSPALISRSLRWTQECTSASR